MPDPIAQYIKASLEKGYTLEQVKQTLLQGRYPEQTIDQGIAAFQQVHGPKQPLTSSPPKVREPTPEEVKDESFFLRLSSILFHPLKHLDKYKGEKGIGTPFKFMFFTIIIGTSLTSLFSFMQTGAFGIVLIDTIKAIIFLTVMDLISAGLLHIWIKVVGGKEGFYQTLKAFAYPGALYVPGSLFIGLALFTKAAWIAVLILSIWNLVLLESCLKAYTGLGTGRLVLAIFLFIITLFALTFFLTLLVALLGFPLAAGAPV